MISRVIAFSLFSIIVGSNIGYGAVICIPAEINLGRVVIGQAATVEATVRNSGEKSVRILAVHPDCSCTHVSMGQQSLQPGESTFLHLTVTSNDLQSSFIRRITIDTTDGTIQVPVKYRQVKFKNWDIIPASLLLPESSSAEAVKGEISLSYLGKGAADVSQVTCSQSAFRVDKVRSGPSSWKIIVTKMGATAAPGLLQNTLKIETTDGNIGDITVPVYAVIHEGAFIDPNPILIRTLMPNGPGSAVVHIHGIDSKKLTAVTFEEGSAIEMPDQGPGRSYRLTVTAATGLRAGRLRVVEADHEILSVPVVVEPAQ